jgi:hypothetical protein
MPEASPGYDADDDDDTFPHLGARDRRVDSGRPRSGSSRRGRHLDESLHSPTPSESEPECEERRRREAEERIGRVCITGSAALFRLRVPPEPSPLPGVLNVCPGLHVLAGQPMSGKTTFMLHIAACWAQGIAPWPGAPKLPGTRAAILAVEQSFATVSRTLNRVTETSGVGSTEAWVERMDFLGAFDTKRDADDPYDPAAAAELRVLDERGLACLEQHLRDRRDLGDPIGFLVLDSLVRLKPKHLSENSADDMSAWLGELQRIALEHKVWIVLLHHVSHGNRSGAASSARGSTEIGGVAQVSLKLERSPNRPRQRALIVEGNEIEQDKLLFDVCAPDAGESRIDFFRPVAADQEPGDDCPILAAVPFAGAASTSKVAREVFGDVRKCSRDRVEKALQAHQRAGRVRRAGGRGRGASAGWTRVATESPHSTASATQSPSGEFGRDF